MNLEINYQRTSLVRCVSLIMAIFLNACVSAPPQATLPPGERPTATPMSAAPEWTQATESITLENVQQLRHLGRLEAPSPPSTIFDYALSPDSTRLVALNNDYIVAWDLVTGEMVFSASRSGITRVFYSPDKNEIYALYPDGTLAFLDSENGSVKETLPAHAQFSGVLAYFPDEGWLALAGNDNTIKVWDTFERVSMVTLTTTADALAFSPDGSQLAVAGSDVALWNWRERTEIRTLEARPVQFARLAYSSDGRYLAGNSRDAVITWNTESGNVASTVQVGENGASYILRFIPETSIIATGGSSGNIMLWQATTGEAAASLDETEGQTTAIAVSPDGMLAFTASFYNGVKLWSLENLASGSIGRGAFALDNENILDVAWTADGFLALFFDARGPVEVWGVAEN